MAYILKLYTDYETDLKLYSVVLNDEELRLYSNFFHRWLTKSGRLGIARLERINLGATLRNRLAMFDELHDIIHKGKSSKKKIANAKYAQEVLYKDKTIGLVKVWHTPKEKGPGFWEKTKDAFNNAKESAGKVGSWFLRTPKKESNIGKHIAYGAAAAGGVLGTGAIISAANSKKSK